MPRRPEPWSIKQRRGYWYYKVSGGDYHSTGIKVGNWKRTRPQAERFAQDKARLGTRPGNHRTFADYAAPYFLPDSCPWYRMQHGRGNHVQEHYRSQHRSRLELHILPAFGSTSIEDLSPIAIERWLYSLSYASQTKKHILETFGIILRDMRRDGLVTFVLSDVSPPVVRHAERQIPTDKEAAALFPSALPAFRDLWNHAVTTQTRGYGQSKETRFELGVFCALAFSSGMRTSELRALRWPAIHADLGGLVVVETITRDGSPGPPKSKSVRAIPLPRWTIELLAFYQKGKSTRSDKFVFPGHTAGSFLDMGSANRALKAVLRKLGIESNITPHGLRHGYNTRMRSILAEAGFEPYFDATNGFRAATEATDAVLRAFTGHRTRSMTELYDHPELVRQLRFYHKHFRDFIDGYWNFRKAVEAGNQNQEGRTGDNGKE